MVGKLNVFVTGRFLLFLSIKWGGVFLCVTSEIVVDFGTICC